MNCPNCDYPEPIKNGKDRHKKQRWLCPNCGLTFGLETKTRAINEARLVALESRLLGTIRELGEWKMNLQKLDLELLKKLPGYESPIDQDDIPF